MLLKAQKSNALIKSGKLYEVTVCQAKNAPHDIFFRAFTNIEKCPEFDMNFATLEFYFGEAVRDFVF